MHHDKPAQRRNHGADLFSRGIVRSDGRTDGDSPVLGDFRSDVSDASNVKVAMFAGKSKLGGQMLADKIAVKKRDRPAANLEELDHENIRNGRFASAGEAGEKDGEALLIARRKTSPQFLDNF